MSWTSRVGERLQAPALPLAVWLGGLATVTITSIESMFSESHAAFVFARLTAYITALTVATLGVGMVALFGVGCGLMLWWLEDALGARRIARSVGTSLWPLAAYTWVGAVLLLIEPPAAMSVEDLVSPLDAEAGLGDVLAFEWLTQLRYVVMGASLALAIWLLSRWVKLFNGVLAVAFGAALVAAFVSLLGFLASSVAPEVGT